MTPAEYLEEIASPTARDFMADRGNRRKAYLACISAFHLLDYFGRALGLKPFKVGEAIRPSCKVAFDVVEGIANGSKHCGRDRGRDHASFPRLPGSEAHVPAFALDDPDAGLDQGRLGTPGLSVDVPGATMFIDVALREFVVAAIATYPAQAGGTDLGWAEGW